MYSSAPDAGWTAAAGCFKLDYPVWFSEGHWMKIWITRTSAAAATAHSRQNASRSGSGCLRSLIRKQLLSKEHERDFDGVSISVCSIFAPRHMAVVKLNVITV